MDTQAAAYLPAPVPVVLITYQTEPYHYVAVFVNQTRQQAEELFRQKYPVAPGASFDVKEYENVESYSVAGDGTLLVNGSYK